MREATAEEMANAGLVFQYSAPYICRGFVVSGTLVNEDTFHPNASELPIPLHRGYCNYRVMPGTAERSGISPGDECHAIINQRTAHLVRSKEDEA